MNGNDEHLDPGGKDRFASTHWSVILAAGRKSSPGGHAALSALCQIYWRPLYAYIRRRVDDVQESQDLTQEFFARLLERNDVAVADPARGRFRSFLLAALKNFLANEHKKANSLKRGGGKVLLSLDFAAVDSRRRFEPFDDACPERDFDREWAVTLINHVLAQLRLEFVAAGKEAQFEALKKFLSGAADADAYPQAAHALKMSEGAVRTAAHRLRKRYRELLKNEIAHTVAAPDEIDEEIRNLFTALGS